MKKYLQLICLGFVVLLTCVSLSLFSRFPVDAQPYIEKKYVGWNGVIQAWVCSKWNPDGSFIRWLNSCASEFEKDHEGIYLEFIPVQAELLRSMDSSGIRMPDLVFFSPGVIANPTILSKLENKITIRSDLRNYGNELTVPIAMSGYIWAFNPSLMDNVPRNPGELPAFIFPQDIPGAAIVGLLSGTSDTHADEMTLPDSDIDLGLPVSAESESLYSADATDIFIDGGLPCIPVDAKSLARLNRLRENGKGSDWKTAATGEFACTDQILLAAVPIQEETPERAALAEEFISFLLTEDAQDALADIGAFSVNGKRIHSDFSVYAEMDVLLNSLPLYLPNCFSEYSVSNSEAIVRRFLNGEIPAKNVLSLLGFEEV